MIVYEIHRSITRNSRSSRAFYKCSNRSSRAFYKCCNRSSEKSVSFIRVFECNTIEQYYLHRVYFSQQRKKTYKKRCEVFDLCITVFEYNTI